MSGVEKLFHVTNDTDFYNLWSLQLDVKLQVEYMSFSAHADAKGIMQLIRMAEPRNMLLVHGEAVKMEFLKGKIEQEFSKCDSALDKIIWHIHIH